MKPTTPTPTPRGSSWPGYDWPNKRVNPPTPIGGTGAADVASERNRCLGNPNSASREVWLPVPWSHLDLHSGDARTSPDWGNSCLGTGFGKHGLQIGRIWVVHRPKKATAACRRITRALCFRNTIVRTVFRGSGDGPRVD